MSGGEVGVNIHPVEFNGHTGYWHMARQGPHQRTGVVICSAPGRDGRCTYRFLFELAQALAAQGLTVLRFEPLGCGNSADLPHPDEDALAVWQAGLADAAAKLRQITTVDRVILCGVRFSATLALLCSQVSDGLMLFAPVLKGRSWSRELKIAQAVLAPSKIDRPALDGLDADGLFLSATSLAHLQDLSLSPATTQDVPVFLAAHNTESETFGLNLRKTCRNVTIEPFEGFAELFEDTSQNQTPYGLIVKATEWARSTYPSSPVERIDLPLPLEDAVIATKAFCDRLVQFGPGLRGNWCTPSAPQTPSDLAVIICNTSGEPRAGIGGFSAGLARHLAQQGVASLRFDFAGLGDSEPLADGVTHVYETERLDDIRAAVAYGESHGATRFVLTGVCSGGYHAVNIGIKLERVDAIVTINTLKFVWDGEPKVRDLGRSSEAYLALVRDPATWRRLLANRIDVSVILKTLGHRVRSQFRVSNRTKTAAFRKDLIDYLKRGGRIFALLGKEDASLDALEAIFGRRGRRLVKAGGRVMIDDGLDHGLALKTSRDRALSHVSDYVTQL